MSDRLPASTLALSRAFWLIDVEWAGGTLRMSTHPVVVEDGDGELYYHDVFDSLEVDERLMLFEASADAGSVQLAGVWPVNVPRLVAMGHSLASAIVEISRWVEGTDYSARRVVLRGRVTNPQYGEEHEPVRLTVKEHVWQDTALIPASNLRVTGDNWTDEITSLAEDRLGLHYPVVVGQPGRVSTLAVSSIGWVTGSRAVWVDERATADGTNVAEVRVVVAGHHVSATNVWALTDSNRSADSDDSRFIVRNGYDDGGNPIAYIPWFADILGTSVLPGPAPDDDIDAANYDYDYAITDSFGALNGLGRQGLDPSYNTDGRREQLYVAWRDEIDSTAGGVVVDGETIRGAGDVLIWLLEQMNRPIDFGRCRIAMPVLNRFKLDFTVDKQCKVWDYVRAQILPVLPISLVTGPRGAYFILWRYDATAEDATVILDADSDTNVERVSEIESSGDDIVNKATVRYARSIRSGNYMGQVTVDATDADGAIPSSYARSSQRRYRRPDNAPLVNEWKWESQCIYDTTTARMVCDWRVLAGAFERRRVTYAVPESRHPEAERGAVAVVTDSRVYLRRQVCLVENVRTGTDGMLVLDLLLLERPDRDTHHGSIKPESE